MPSDTAAAGPDRERVGSQAPERPAPDHPPLAERVDLTSAGRRAWQALGVLLLVAAIAWLVATLRVVVVAVVLGVLIAAAVAPLVSWLRRRGLGPSAATGAATATWILALIALLALIGLRVAEQIPELVDGLAQGYEQLRQQYPQVPAPADLPERLGSVAGGSSDTGGAARGARVAAEVLTAVLLGVVLSVFFLRDGRSIWEWVLGLLRSGDRARADRMGRAAYRTISEYVRGLTVVALADGVLTGIGLLLLGVPLALALAVLTFLAAYIPTVGALVVGAIAVGLAFATGGAGTALAVLVLYTAVQQLDSNVLQPLVMGRRLPLHPAAVLIALTVGGVVAGVVGALLGVPTAAAAVAAGREWLSDGPAGDGETPRGEVGR